MAVCITCPAGTRDAGKPSCGGGVVWPPVYENGHLKRLPNPSYAQLLAECGRPRSSYSRRMHSGSSRAILHGIGILNDNTLGIGAAGEDPAICQIPWRGTTSNPVLKRMQKKINVELATLGYQPITADGFFGPATCGALEVLQAKDITKASNLFSDDVMLPECPNGLVLPTCQSSTPPQKKGALPGKVPPSPPVDSGDSTTMALVGGGAALLLVGAAVWMFTKGRRSSGRRTTRRISTRTTARA